MRPVLLFLFVLTWMPLAGAESAAIRFHAEAWHGNVPASSAADRGRINRVQYRVTGPKLTIERDPIEEPNAQKETKATPEEIPGAPWIKEPLPVKLAEADVLGWGDFDGDGSDELLAGWPAAIWKRNGKGQWVEIASVVGLRRSETIAVVDANRDGLADIVVSSGEKPILYRNETRLSWVRHVISSGYKTQTAVAADFNGDGRLDIITGDIENDHKISYYAAPDWKRTVLRSGIRVIQSLALDVDGDGDLDYIASQYHPGLIFWLEHPKDPKHDTWTYHLIDDAKGGVDGVHGLALADLDGDGKPELIAVSDWPQGAFPNSIVWFRIPSHARDAERWPRFVLANRDAPGFGHYLGIGDVNGDALPDVATGAKAGPEGNWFAWWQHPHDLSLPWKKEIIATNQPGATNILIRDLNGDGRPDFLASRGHGQGVVWFEAPNWTAHEINQTLIGPHALAIADLDGDGDADFVVCAKDSGILAWYENDGRGNFTEHRIFEDQSAYEVKLVDMNGDGRLDILVAGQESQNVVWYENRLPRQAQRSGLFKHRK